MAAMRAQVTWTYTKTASEEQRAAIMQAIREILEDREVIAKSSGGDIIPQTITKQW